MQTKTKKALNYFFAVVFLLAFSFPAQAIEYGMLGGKPANPDPNVENSVSWFIYKLNAGEAKDDAAKILNLFDNALDVLVYAADTTASSGGGFALEQFSEPKDEVGAWVKFYPEAVPEYFAKLFEKKEKKISVFCQMKKDNLNEELTGLAIAAKEIKGTAKIEISDENFSIFENWCQGKEAVELNMKAKEQKDIPFVIRVPESADTGEHTGGILIQKKAVDDAAGDGGSSVKLTTRVGVRIYETVPGEIIRKITVEDFRIVKKFNEFSFSDWFGKEKKPKEFLIETRIANGGNVSIAHDNNIYIKGGFFGGEPEKVERNFQILKKDKFVANYSWKKPLFGRYKFQGEIKYQGASGEEILKTPELILWVIPWREITIFILIAGLAAAGYWLWRKKQKKKYGGIGWAEYKIKKNDTVAKLSEKHGIDWRILVKTNKINAPYLLEAGQVILIPPSGAEQSGKKSEGNAGSGNQEGGGGNIPENNPVTAGAGKEIAEKPEKTKNIFNFLKNKKTRNIILAAIGTALLAGAFIAVWKIAQNKKETEIKEKISIMSLGAGNAEVNPPAGGEENPPNAEAGKPAEEKREAPKAKTPAELKVKVLNGGAAAGTAGKIKDFLIGKGYSQAEAANAESEERLGAAVYYKEEISKQEAQWIKEMLVGKSIEAEIKLAESEEEKSADIVVMLGK